MPVRLYKRPNGIYHLRGTVQGQRIDQSARTRVAAEAEQVRAKIEGDAFRRAIYGERSVGTFAAAALDYMNAGGERTHLKPLILQLGPMLLTDVTQRAIDEIAGKRKVKPATLIRQIYTPAAAVINHANGPGAPKISFRKPRVRTPRTGYLTPAEAEAWIRALPTYLSGLVTFLLATGCRVSEALALEWKDVSPEGQRVVFWDTKSGHARGVDLQTRARLVLPRRGDGPVFRNSRGEPWHGYDAINLMLRRYHMRSHKVMPEHNLARVHCHLFRHTWATWAYAMTRDLTFVMQQGGWRSLAMVERYTHLGSPDLADAAIAFGWEVFGRQIIHRGQKQPYLS